MSEKLFERKLREAVKALGGIAIKIYSPSFTGLPDRLVLAPPGRLWFVELKSPGKKQSPRQKLVSAMLEKVGFKTHVIDSEQALNAFLNHTQNA